MRLFALGSVAGAFAVALAVYLASGSSAGLLGAGFALGLAGGLLAEGFALRHWGFDEAARLMLALHEAFDKRAARPLRPTVAHGRMTWRAR